MLPGARWRSTRIGATTNPYKRRCHSPVCFGASAACAVCPARFVYPTVSMRPTACPLHLTWHCRAVGHVHGCTCVHMHQRHACCCQTHANSQIGIQLDTGSQVSEDNLDGLQAQQAGLLRLSLNILERHQDLDAAAPCANFKVLLGCMHAEQKATVCRLRSTCGSNIPEALMSPSCLQGLGHLTNLTRLTIRTSDVIGCQPLSVIAGLTSLRCMRLPSPPDPSPLSALR